MTREERKRELEKMKTSDVLNIFKEHFGEPTAPIKSQNMIDTILQKEFPKGRPNTS